MVGGATGSTYLLGDADVGAQISVRASFTDVHGTSENLTSTPTATVANTNDAPLLVQPLANREVTALETMRFALPPASFSDPDTGDTLQYVAALADGSALPAWLSFDAVRLEFSGNPGENQVGTFLVRVTVTDLAGAAAEALFQLDVVLAPPPIAEPITVVATPSVALTPQPTQATPTPAKTTASNTSDASDGGDSAVPVESTGGLDNVLAPAAAVSALVIDAPVNSARAVTSDAAEATGTVAPASRADAVLSGALVAQVSDASTPTSTQFLRSDELARRFEEAQRRVLEQDEARRATIASSIVVSGGVSIGYVIWLVRGGVLMGSMISALPAWQMIDPMPVLAAARNSKHRPGAGSGDGDDVERLFEGSKKARAARDTTAKVPIPDARRAAQIDSTEPQA